jgi:hypothetical protein
MPVYNGAPSLPAAVESVLAQTLSNLEVLIVDDGSSDDTAHIAEQFAARDPRVQLMRHDNNRGPAAARNLALEAARGAWLAPVDADDEISPDRLRLLVEAGERADADLIADGIFFHGTRPHGTPAELMTWESDGHDLEVLTAEALIQSDLPAGERCSLGYLKPLMRRHFLNEHKLRYPEDLRFAEDFHLYARALICGARFVLFPESHYVYRQTPASASRAEALLPRMARQAVTSSRRLRRALPQPVTAELRAMLDEHEQRWTLLSWFEQMKSAVAGRQVRRAVELLFKWPTSPGKIIRFAGERARMKRQAAEPEGP